MNINNNFIGSRMNKSLDERLIGPGDYIDAQNIRIASDEDGEAGSAENSKGNIELASAMYKGAPLVDAKCIGVFDNGTKDTLYWFITSPAVDMIISYSVESNNLIYHVISTSVLNFSADYPINSINLVDDLLFFTDNYNAPRKINVTRGYPEPVGTVGYDLISEDDISVIVKPPIEAPTLSLRTNVTTENFMEDKFLRFSCRYEYADGEYSALSEFSDLAFSPGQFELDYSDYDMVGMRNRFNNVEVSFNTGSKHVKGVDICFKQSNSNVVAVVQKFNKQDEGWGDDLIRSVSFSNKKIYTTLTESELLRMFDNVPRKASQQTVMGNRLMYGNYIDGYNIDTNVNYNLELIAQDVSEGVLGVTDSHEPVFNSTSFTLDFTGQDLTEGMILYVDVKALHYSFEPFGTTYPTTVENDLVFGWSFRLPRDFDSVNDLATSSEFLASVHLTSTYANSSEGSSMTDFFFNNIVAATAPTVWDKISLVQYDIFSGFYDSQITIDHVGDFVKFNLPGVKFEEVATPGLFAYETFRSANSEASLAGSEKAASWHSNRDYEVAIEYMDEYERASTALVSTENTIFVNSEQMVTQNSIRVSVNSLAPSWAKRYRFVVKPSAGDYETIYSNFYYQDYVDGGAWWIRLEGDNQTKAATGDVLIVKSDSAGPTGELITTKILDIKAQERDFLDSAESAGLYMKVRANNFSIINDPLLATTENSYTGEYSSGIWGILASTSEEIPDTSPQEYREIAIPTGSKVRLKIRSYRFGTYDFDWGFEQTYSAQNSYDNLYDFIQGENVNFDQPYRNSGMGGISDGDENTAVWYPQILTTSQMNKSVVYNPGNPVTPLYTGDVWAYQPVYLDRQITIQYVRNADGNAWLYANVMSNGTSNRPSRIRIEYEIIKPGELLVFETKPEEVSDDIYYQSSKSYPIQSPADSSVGNYIMGVQLAESLPQTFQYRRPMIGAVDSEVLTEEIVPGGIFQVQAIIGSVSLLTSPQSVDNIAISYTPAVYTGDIPIRGHYGSFQDQTSSLPAVIDLDMYNCFVFGNGVESFKINDAYSTPGFRIGARVTSVSEEDYKEANRYADMTYSGVYNASTNLNKLNEFNLGLANYKSLEQSFGPINKLHGRQTDILVLQEDKISYVLGGKNLLSDAGAGGAIVSTPQVLGTQMSRVDEIGISQDTESFAVEGPDTFFTDSKRGIVVNLKGGTSAEALNIISSLGMRSWFRDTFIDSNREIKLGAYDSYMDEYVLTFTDTERPIETPSLGCGVSISQTGAVLGQDLNYEIQLQDVLGTCDIDWEFFYGSSEVLTENVVPGGVSQFTAIIGSVSLLTSPQNPSNVVISHTSAGTTVSGEDVGFYTVAVQLVEPNTQIVQYAAVYAGSAQLSVVYGGTEVINQTISTTGTRLFNKNLDAINTAFVTITPIPNEVSPGVYQPVTYDFSFGCVDTQAVSVIQFVTNATSLESSVVNRSYSWSQGTLDSVSASGQTVLGEGPVSTYVNETGISGQGSFPPSNSVVTMKHTTPVTNLPWDAAYRLKYLSSNILYTDQDIATLSPLLSEATVVQTGDNATGTFTYSKSVEAYLYLVWEYN